jgi:hypothetical protein
VDKLITTIAQHQELAPMKTQILFAFRLLQLGTVQKATMAVASVTAVTQLQHSITLHLDQVTHVLAVQTDTFLVAQQAQHQQQ